MAFLWAVYSFKRTNLIGWIICKYATFLLALSSLFLSPIPISPHRVNTIQLMFDYFLVIVNCAVIFIQRAIFVNQLVTPVHVSRIRFFSLRFSLHNSISLMKYKNVWINSTCTSINITKRHYLLFQLNFSKYTNLTYKTVKQEQILSVLYLSAKPQICWVEGRYLSAKPPNLLSSSSLQASPGWCSIIPLAFATNHSLYIMMQL